MYSNEYLSVKGASLSQKDTCEIYCYDETKVHRIQQMLHENISIWLIFLNTFR